MADNDNVYKKAKTMYMRQKRGNNFVDFSWLSRTKAYFHDFPVYTLNAAKIKRNVWKLYLPTDIRTASCKQHICQQEWYVHQQEMCVSTNAGWEHQAPTLRPPLLAPYSK